MTHLSILFLLLYGCFFIHTGMAWLSRGVEFHDHVSSVFLGFCEVVSLSLGFFDFYETTSAAMATLNRTANQPSFSVKQFSIMLGSKPLLRSSKLFHLTFRVFSESKVRLLDNTHVTWTPPNDDYFPKLSSSCRSSTLLSELHPSHTLHIFCFIRSNSIGRLCHRHIIDRGLTFLAVFFF